MVTANERRAAKGWLGAGLAVAAAAALLLAVAAPGCETQPPYASCALDPEVTDKGVCNGKGSSSTGKTSCVVTQHPHCTAGVCLSYFGTESVCTTACSSDSDCVDGGFCWQFVEGEKYCVPADRKP